MNDLTYNSKRNGLVLSISESSTNDKVQVRISDGGLQKRISKRKKQLALQMAQIKQFVLAVDRLDAQVENITRRRSNRLKSIGESEAVSDVNTLDEVCLQTFTSDEDTSVSKLKGGKVLDMNDSSHGSTNATATTTSQSSDSVSLLSSENLEAKNLNTDANKRNKDTKTKNVKPMLYIRKESLEHQISSLELDDDTKKINKVQPQRTRTRTCSTVSVTSSSNGGDSLTNKEEDTNQEDTFKHWKDMGWLVGFEN